MNKYLNKFKATNYEHCIIKEELIIPDDEESDGVDVETVDEAINESLLDKNVEHNGFNKTSKIQIKRQRSERLKNKNDKQSTIDLFLNTKNPESTELLKTLTNVKSDKKPRATVKAAKSDNLDKLYKKFTKSHCRKCNVKRAVIRQKGRCRECKTQLTYICEPCNKTYGDVTNLGYHLQSHHTDNPQSHPCPVCKKVFAHRKGMQEHRRTIHNSVESLAGEQWCAKCDKKFTGKNMRKHEKICGQEPAYKCDQCSFAAFYKSNLQRHMLDKHTDFKKACENCNKTFTNRRSMGRHMRVYCNKAKRIECHHCGHKFYRRDQVLIHLDQAHFGGSLTGNLVNDSQGPGICKYCDTTLDKDEWMRTHLERCESAPLSFRRQIPPYDGYDGSFRNCKYCGMYLERYGQMRYHLERCESAPSDCRIESEMADQPDLDTAVKNLTKAFCENCKIKRPLKLGKRRCKKCYTLLKCTCERCAKTFIYEKLLLDHLRVKHVKNKEFHQCDECSRSYSHLKHLKLHKKTHHPSNLTTKTYTCSKCGKNYNNEPSFRKHRVSCVEEPKFHCHKCPYKTHFKSSLVDHFRAKRAKCI